MAHFEHTDFQDLFKAALAVLGSDYQGPTRSSFFAGIPPGYLGGLPVAAAPNIQLMGDLNRLNRDVVLADGVVPLEVWLGNAVLLYSARPDTASLRQFLTRTSGRAVGAPSVAARPADDQVTLQAILGRDETLAFGFLEAGHRVGQCVAKLLVPRHENGQPARASDGSESLAKGSGWLLTKDLLMTNHHVVNARAKGEDDASDADLRKQAAATRVQFDFDTEGGPMTVAAVTGLEFADKPLDFAILRLAASQQRPVPVFRPGELTASPQQPFPVNIIQHPRGKPKRIAIRNNLVYEVAGDFVRYGTDTDEGSSGSPVFDDAWNVVALHRAARYNKGPGATLPVVNEGVLWSSIQRRLADSGKNALLQEID